MVQHASHHESLISSADTEAGSARFSRGLGSPSGIHPAAVLDRGQGADRSYGNHETAVQFPGNVSDHHSNGSIIPGIDKKKSGSNSTKTLSNDGASRKKSRNTRWSQ